MFPAHVLEQTRCHGSCRRVCVESREAKGPRDRPLGLRKSWRYAKPWLLNYILFTADFFCYLKGHHAGNAVSTAESTLLFTSPSTLTIETLQDTATHCDLN